MEHKLINLVSEDKEINLSGVNYKFSDIRTMEIDKKGNIVEIITNEMADGLIANAEEIIKTSLSRDKKEDKKEDKTE